MKIIAFSINPQFPDKINGGAAKHLHNVTVHLGELGHDVTLLCTPHPDSNRPFQWHQNVTVKPVLPFKQPFPEPYAVPAYRIAEVIQQVGQHLVDADRFYLHDGELLFPPLYQHIPTVISLRDNVYPETILGSFLFQGDALIAIADYSRQIYLHTAGRFLPDLANRTVTINNGIDFARFSPGDPDSELFDYVSDVDPETDLIILHPHRPEPSKGLPQTIAVADLLIHRYGFHNLKVLIPRWFDADISDEVDGYYQEIQSELQRRGLSDHFVFHSWIPQRLMPDYYRLGNLTLVLGHFVEAFGNVAYESLSCGTPAIVARVATHRSLLPDHLIPKVHFGNNEVAAATAAEILHARQQTPVETMAYLHTHFGIENQLEQYTHAILGAQKLPPVRFHLSPSAIDTRYRLAPWCYHWDSYIYHDFLASHEPLTDLIRLIQAYPKGFTPQMAARYAVSLAQIEQWTAEGYIVPYE